MSDADLKPSTIKALTFLKDWHATTGVWPMLSAVTTDLATGKRGAFMTKCFPPDSTGAVDWKAVHSWIDVRQGKANLYFSVNKLKNAIDKKAERTDIAEMVALHVDVDVRVGEDQKVGIERILNVFASYKVPPSVITVSGGGAQAFWILKDHIVIDGDIVKAEDAKLYNIALERDLGGDACHNIDRIMRLPGTINIPNETKRKKGRVPSLAYVERGDVATVYDLGTFEKATPTASNTAAQTGSKPTGGNGATTGIGGAADHTPTHEYTPKASYASIDPHDPRIAKLPEKWRVIGMLGDTNGEYLTDGKPDRSKLAIAFACACVGAGISDDMIAAMLMDKSWVIGEPLRDKKNVNRELKRTIERAHAWTKNPKLDEMNEAHHVVSHGGKTRVMTWEDDEVFAGRKDAVYRTPEDFIALHSDEFYEFEAKNKDGELEMVKIPLGKWWWNQPGRRQYNGGLTFEPTIDADRIGGGDTVLHKNAGKLNLWRGFAVAPVPGDCSMFLAHIRENICSGNEAYYNYLINWLARMIQHPDKPGEVAVCLKGERGVGKTFFANMVGMLLGRHYLAVTNPDHLTGKFNPHLQELILILADECFYAGDRKHEQILKTQITGETLIIEPKGVNAFAVRNRLHMIIASNSKWVIPAGEHERRFFMLEVSQAHMQDSGYFARIADQMKNKGGAQALLNMLLKIDLSTFDVRAVPQTAALERQKALTRRGVDAFIEQICHDGILPCGYYKKPNVSLTVPGNNRDDGLFQWLVANYPDLKYKTPQALGAELADWGIKPWRYPRQGIRGLEFPLLPDLQKRFETTHGPQNWAADIKEWEASGTMDGPGQSGPGAVKADDARIPF